MKRRDIILLSVVVVCVFVLLIVIFAGGIFGYFLLEDIGKKPQEVVINVSAPNEVGVGEVFDIVIVISNFGDESVLLQDVDIPVKYFDYVGFMRSEPAFVDSVDAWLLDENTYSYYIEVPAGGELVLSLSFMAENAGKLDGTFDVCIDSVSNCFPQLLYIIITE